MGRKGRNSADLQKSGAATGKGNVTEVMKQMSQGVVFLRLGVSGVRAHQSSQDVC